MTARRSSLVSLVAVLAVAAVAVPAQAASRSAGAWSDWPGSADRWQGSSSLQLRSQARHGSVGRSSVPVPVPQVVELSAATRTLYATSDAGIVAVIDARRCNARRTSGCDAPVATMTFAAATTGDLSIDEVSGTGYVTNIELGTVSLFDAAHCNARDISGCDDDHPTIAVGGVPVGTSVDPATRTLYVGNVESRVSVIDMAACNRTSTAGCAEPRAQVTTNPGAVWPTVDRATRTVYVPENGPDDDSQPPGSTLAVIDGSDCNATTTSGCGDVPARVTVGNAPAVAAVDPETRTVYVENQFDLSVSVVNGATCNGENTSGCGQTPPTIHVGEQPNSNLVVDRSTRTLFVVNSGSDTISAVDIRDCHAGNTSGCSRRSPTIQTGNEPFWIELDPSTGTLYVPHHIDEDVTAFDARVCNARRRAGCRREAPTVAIPDGVYSVEVDPSTHTLWAGGGDTGALSLVDTRRCRAGALSGCGQTPFETPLANQLRRMVHDRATHTLYVIDLMNASLLVLDASTCNVRRHTDCAPLATITTGDFPIALALNPRTHAVYTANIGGGSVSVIDGAHCNAVDASGCAAPPETVPLDGGPFGVAVDPRTNTAYVSLIDANEVAVLHGSEPVGTIPGIPGPAGLDVDRRTRTLYVTNFAGAEAPGALSAVDIDECNGLDTGGCEGPWPTTSTGRGPWDVVVDPSTHRVFTADLAHATVSVIQGASCNARIQRGCARGGRQIPVGNIPLDLALDRVHRTLYAANAPDRDVSVINSRAGH